VLFRSAKTPSPSFSSDIFDTVAKIEEAEDHCVQTQAHQRSGPSAEARRSKAGKTAERNGSAVAYRH
jgi:hypothetical protein